jgi:hypothetical protein
MLLVCGIRLFKLYLEYSPFQPSQELHVEQNLSFESNFTSLVSSLTFAMD